MTANPQEYEVTIVDVPDKLIGLDLFSGIGGITVALAPWVRPIAYCDNDRYVTAVLLSRMADGSIPVAPIWDDVTTLKGSMLPPIDIIYGGFPCQDISVAGRGAGLEGKRSGLFFEICRLVDEIRPRFIFLENVPAITVRGLDRVIGELSALRYDCRWTIVSAAEVGANHLRRRWFLLAFANDNKSQQPKCNTENQQSNPSGAWGSVRIGTSGRSIIGDTTEGDRQLRTDASEMEGKVAHAGLLRPPFSQEQTAGVEQCGEDVADSNGTGFRDRRGSESGEPEHRATQCGSEDGDSTSTGLSDRSAGEMGGPRSVEESQRSDWWTVEPNVGRVAHGVQNRVDRLRSLGNAVVPLQAREAFKRLITMQNAAHTTSSPPPAA